MKKILCTIAFLSFSVFSAANAEHKPNKATPLFSHELEGFPNKEGLMLMVDLPPGGSDLPHRHNASVFVYMLEGTVEMKLKGKEAVTLKRGDTFFEGLNDVHEIGRNLSNTEPAKFIVFFVKDKGKDPVIPVK